MPNREATYMNGSRGFFARAASLECRWSAARNYFPQIVKRNRAPGIRILKASIDRSEGLLINLHLFT